MVMQFVVVAREVCMNLARATSGKKRKVFVTLRVLEEKRSVLWAAQVRIQRCLRVEIPHEVARCRDTG